MAKESYEDIMETTKSCATVKNPELSEYNICGMSQDDEMVMN